VKLGMVEYEEEEEVRFVEEQDKEEEDFHDGEEEVEEHLLLTTTIRTQVNKMETTLMLVKSVEEGDFHIGEPTTTTTIDPSRRIPYLLPTFPSVLMMNNCTTCSRNTK